MNLNAIDTEVMDLNARLIYCLEKRQSAANMHSPVSVFKECAFMQNCDQEIVVAIALDCNGTMIGRTEIHRGTLTSCPLEMRTLFKYLFSMNANSFVLVHNHPNGNPMPSPADIGVTKNLRIVGEIMGIPCHDHLIIGDGVFYSFRTTESSAANTLLRMIEAELERCP